MTTCRKVRVIVRWFVDSLVYHFFVLISRAGFGRADAGAGRLW